MSRHAGPPRADDAPAVPEPTFAERARTLAYLGRTGTLATLSRRHPGHPFASVMPYALDDAGRPVVLISSMAMHTQNLQADPRASLLVTQPGLGPQREESDDPLARARVVRFFTLGAQAGLGHEEARARIGLEVLGVHGHRADQDGRPPGVIERVRHDRCERVAGVAPRERRERADAPDVGQRPRALGVGRLGDGRCISGGRGPGVRAHSIFLSAAIA